MSTPLPPPAWAADAVLYHLYPLGACGAPAHNDLAAAPVNRLDALTPWLGAWSSLGINTVYLGPVFESSSHGYDTADYRRVDRRLGDEHALARLVDGLHARGIRVLLDAVFHHVGRDFWAFRDVQQKGEASPYTSWFAGLRFGQGNRHGDPFVYDGWRGVDTLVKLNLHEPAVRAHLFEAVRFWVERWGIDGLRLDAADSIDLGFFDALNTYCAGLGKDLWLLGEVIHGDYREWARPGRLHSTTDYALWKALWSSHNDRNYFELAHTLKREVSPEGMYAGLTLCTFAENHDVTRLASQLTEPRHLPLVYLLLFTLPGAPALYYGGEWGQQGVKVGAEDAPLRPPLPEPPGPPSPLREQVARYVALRREHEVLRRGTYRELVVRNEQLAFLREGGGSRLLVAVNLSDKPAPLEVQGVGDGRWVDLLDPQRTWRAGGGRLFLGNLPPFSAVVAKPV